MTVTAPELDCAFGGWIAPDPDLIVLAVMLVVDALPVTSATNTHTVAVAVDGGDTVTFIDSVWAFNPKSANCTPVTGEEKVAVNVIVRPVTELPLCDDVIVGVGGLYNAVKPELVAAFGGAIFPEPAVMAPNEIVPSW